MASKERCRCGSGKRRSRCHPGAQHERTTNVHLQFASPVTVDKMAVHHDGYITVLSPGDLPTPAPIALEFASSYDRVKGRKVTVRIPFVRPGNRTPVTIGAVLEQYSRFYLIDTAFADTPCGRHAAAAVFVGHQQMIAEGLSCVPFELVGMIDFAGVKAANPERVAWLTLAEIVRRAPDYDFRWSLGLVTDSDLGDHQAVNERSVPITGTTYLPFTFKLIYSSDQGNDSPFNASMRLADRYAGEMLKAIVRKEFPDTDRRLSFDPEACATYRVWTRNDNEERIQTDLVPAAARLDSLLRPVGAPLITRAPRLYQLGRSPTVISGLSSFGWPPPLPPGTSARLPSDVMLARDVRACSPDSGSSS